VDSEIKVKYIFLTRQHYHTQKVGLMQVWTSAAEAAVGALEATGAAAAGAAVGATGLLRNKRCRRQDIN